MRLYLGFSFASCLSLLIACSSTTVVKATRDGDSADATTADDAQTGDGGGTSHAGETFDLVVSGGQLDTASSFTEDGRRGLDLFVAVEDADSGERVALKSMAVVAPAQSYAFSFPGLLQGDHHYRVGLSGVPNIGEELIDVPAVSGPVTLVRDQPATASADTSDDDAVTKMLFTPVPLPAGTYATGHLTASGVFLDLVVSPGKRLYVSDYLAGCDCAKNGHGPSAETGPNSCGQELFFRGDTSFAYFHGRGGSDASIFAKVTVSGSGLRVEGNASSVLGGGVACCSEDLVQSGTAGRSSAGTGTCM